MVLGLVRVAKKLDEVIELLEDIKRTDNSLFASYIGFKNELITRDFLSLKGACKEEHSQFFVHPT